MIEKLFLIVFVSFIGILFYSQNESYNNKLKEYYYCTPYNPVEDPSIPPLTNLELVNFETNYPNFTSKYICDLKLYTPKQFYLMRKARK